MKVFLVFKIKTFTVKEVEDSTRDFETPCTLVDNYSKREKSMDV